MYAKYEKKKTKKAINYWNYYTKEHFERLAEAIQKGEEELGGNQSNAASSAQQVSTVVESDIKTCSSTFSQVIRKDLDPDTKHHAMNNLQDTLEKATNHTIEYSIQPRRLMLLFTDH